MFSNSVKRDIRPIKEELSDSGYVFFLQRFILLPPRLPPNNNIRKMLCPLTPKTYPRRPTSYFPSSSSQQPTSQTAPTNAVSLSACSLWCRRHRVYPPRHHLSHLYSLSRCLLSSLRNVSKYYKYSALGAE